MTLEKNLFKKKRFLSHGKNLITQKQAETADLLNTNVIIKDIA